MIEPTVETEFLHLPVLNVESPTGDILLFRMALRRHTIKLDYVGRDGLMFSGGLEGKSIYPMFRVIDKTLKGNPRRFDGYYIGEVFRGSAHPLVLVPCDVVSDCLRGPGIRNGK
jgi:hypothetical protein